MPATNNENEGSLGSFRQLMRQQPQLILLGHNAMAMFSKMIQRHLWLQSLLKRRTINFCTNWEESHRVWRSNEKRHWLNFVMRDRQKRLLSKRHGRRKLRKMQHELQELLLFLTKR